MSTITGDREDRPFSARALDEQLPDAGLINTSDTEITALRAKSGWQTSQGLLTALLVLGALGYLLFGPSYAPERLQNATTAAFAFAEKVAPLVAAALVLVKYVNSRGKVQSNELWANASVSSPLAMLVKGPLAGTDAATHLSQLVVKNTIPRAVFGEVARPDGGITTVWAHVEQLAGRVVALEEEVVTGGGLSARFASMVKRLEKLEQGEQMASAADNVLKEYADDLALIALYLYVKGGWGELDNSNLKLRNSVQGVAAVARQALAERRGA